MNKKNPINIKYAPTIATALVFILLLALNMLLFFGRKTVRLRSGFLMNIFTDFYQHVSNFSLSYAIYSMVGFIWLMLGVSFRYIAAMGIALIFINAVYELFIPVLNTRDIIDAYYGIAGSLAAFMFLMITHRSGMKPYLPAD